MRKQRFRRRTTILQCGQPGHALYVILAGRVKVHNETSEGKEHVIAVLSAGEMFGELDLIDGRGRSADVTTLEPTEVLMITRDAMTECIRHSPQIAWNLMATLAGRVRLANEKSEAIGMDVKGRLAKHLLLLAREYGVKTPTGVQIDLRLSQSDIAAFIGTSRETVSKILGEFRGLGWLAVDKQRRITLLREDRLMGRCGG